MISQAMADAFNKQINEELFSSYLYASMTTYFEHKSLKGFAHWMRLQTEEENAHANKFIKFMEDRGGRVILAAIEAPKTDWDSPLQVFEEALAHEEHISKCINELSTQAIAEDDHASHGFLKWFVGEQVEEEANVGEVVDQLRLVEGAPAGLFLMDREVGTRVAEAPGEESA